MELNPIELITDEHERIKRELIELETIMESPEINYPNLIHTFHKLHIIWNAHEIKEAKIFELIEEKGFVMPFKKILFEHHEFEVHYCAVLDAINSGSEFEIKEVFSEHLIKLIEKARMHQENEENALYSLPIEFTEEEIEKLNEFFN